MTNMFPRICSTFPLGQLVFTTQAIHQLWLGDAFDALSRHAWQDWGDVCPEDWKANDEALLSGCRLLSSYRDRKGVKFWIITEADRSATTVLLPDDY
jgi:hypothetical protein